MSKVKTGSALEEQVKKQVDRTGALISGEFEEATDAGLIKYVVTVHQSVEHLEGIAAPLVDQKYLDNAPDSSKLDKKLDKENVTDILHNAEKKFRYLTKMLYREGVL